MDDPRKFKRMPVKMSCRLLCDNDPTPVTATVLDVSLGGMAVVTARELPVGATVELQHSDFPCASTSRATSRCQVITVRSAKGRSQGFRLGLTFAATDTAFIQSLLQWVQLQSVQQKQVPQRNRASQPNWA